MGSLTRTAGPAVEPITLALAKTHMRVTISADDSYITEIIKVARQILEDAVSRSLVNQTWVWRLDRWPRTSTFLIPLAPLSSVTSVKYTDRDGDQSTLDSDNYIVDTTSEPGRIRKKVGVIWPIPSPGLREISAVEVAFVAGFGAAAANVPETYKHVLKMILGHLYENREETIPKVVSVEELPSGVQRLITPLAAWNAFAHVRVHADQDF